jgi:hypothetical protein
MVESLDEARSSHVFFGPLVQGGWTGIRKLLNLAKVRVGWVVISGAKLSVTAG